MRSTSLVASRFAVDLGIPSATSPCRCAHPTANTISQLVTPKIVIYSTQAGYRGRLPVTDFAGTDQAQAASR